MARRKVKRRSLLFFVPYFSARLDFPSSPLSVPGSPRMDVKYFRVLLDQFLTNGIIGSCAGGSL